MIEAAGPSDKPPANAEQARLAEDASGAFRWKHWGPYLSERQWGTVREDYSPHGNAADPLQAVEWAQKGAALGGGRAMLNLSVHYEDGAPRRCWTNGAPSAAAVATKIAPTARAA